METIVECRAYWGVGENVIPATEAANLAWVQDQIKTRGEWRVIRVEEKYLEGGPYGAQVTIYAEVKRTRTSAETRAGGVKNA